MKKKIVSIDVAREAEKKNVNRLAQLVGFEAEGLRTEVVCAAKAFDASIKVIPLKRKYTVAGNV